MTIEAIGRYNKAPKSRTGIIYVPSDLAIDSAFPFKDDAVIKIRIEGKRLIIEDAKE